MIRDEYLDSALLDMGDLKSVVKQYDHYFKYTKIKEKYLDNCNQTFIFPDGKLLRCSFYMTSQVYIYEDLNLIHEAVLSERSIVGLKILNNDLLVVIYYPPCTSFYNSKLELINTYPDMQLDTSLTDTFPNGQIGHLNYSNSQFEIYDSKGKFLKSLFLPPHQRFENIHILSNTRIFFGYYGNYLASSVLCELEDDNLTFKDQKGYLPTRDIAVLSGERFSEVSFTDVRIWDSNTGNSLFNLCIPKNTHLTLHPLTDNAFCVIYMHNEIFHIEIYKNYDRIKEHTLSIKGLIHTMISPNEELIIFDTSGECSAVNLTTMKVSKKDITIDHNTEVRKVNNEIMIFHKNKKVEIWE